MPLPESLQRLRAQIFAERGNKSPTRTANRYGAEPPPSYLVGPGGLTENWNGRPPEPRDKDRYIGAPTTYPNPSEEPGALGWRQTASGGWELYDTAPPLPRARPGEDMAPIDTSLPDMTSEPWLAPTPAVGINVGDPAPRRGLEPPSAPVQQTQYEAEAIAMAEARARVQARIEAERRQEMARIPRPGYPLIAQAWAEPGALRRRRDGQ